MAVTELSLRHKITIVIKHFIVREAPDLWCPSLRQGFDPAEASLVFLFL